MQVQRELCHDKLVEAYAFGLGLDAPWYLAELAAVGYVSIVALLVFVAWAAGAAQVVALSTERYAPYPKASERPPQMRAGAQRLADVLGERADIGSLAATHA